MSNIWLLKNVALDLLYLLILTYQKRTTLHSFLRKLDYFPSGTKALGHKNMDFPVPECWSERSDVALK